MSMYSTATKRSSPAGANNRAAPPRKKDAVFLRSHHGLARSHRDLLCSHCDSFHSLSPPERTSQLNTTKARRNTGFTGPLFFFFPLDKIGVATFRSPTLLSELPFASSDRIVSLMRERSASTSLHKSNRRKNFSVPAPEGGQRWIRTTEGVSQQIYSLPHLATLVFALLCVCDGKVRHKSRKHQAFPPLCSISRAKN